MVGLASGRLGRGLGLQEADRDDRLAVLVDQALDVGRVVRGALRFAEERRVAERRGVFEALLGQVVEALVAQTAGVERDAGLPAVLAALWGRGRGVDAAADGAARRPPTARGAADGAVEAAGPNRPRAGCDVAPSASSLLEMCNVTSSSETPGIPPRAPGSRSVR